MRPHWRVCWCVGVGEGRCGVVISQSTQDATHAMLDCCCAVLAFMLADPVYKVFVAALVGILGVCCVSVWNDLIDRSSMLIHVLLLVVNHTDLTLISWIYFTTQFALYGSNGPDKIFSMFPLVLSNKSFLYQGKIIRMHVLYTFVKFLMQKILQKLIFIIVCLIWVWALAPCVSKSLRVFCNLNLQNFTQRLMYEVVLSFLVARKLI